MPDQGTKATDKKLRKLEKQLEEIYSEAEKDITAKLREHTDKFVAKEEKYQQMLDNGEITQKQFDSWKSGQVFIGKMWKAKRNSIVNTMVNTNAIATRMINGGKIDVFAENANWTAYTLEHGEGINFGFGLYDATTVTRLIKENPKMLPEWKINEPKDYIWNEKKVNRQITQGIIQGESLDKISKRLTTSLVTQNENHMKTFARTALTGAQNAGREQRLSEAKSMGINVLKEWMATLDGKTRDSHAALDGEKIKVGDRWHPMKFSNGCRFPGDPEGPASEVYNCRCTLVGDLEDYPEEYKRYDNIDGKPIENMSYKEWKKLKKDTATIDDYRKRVTDIDDQLKAYGSYYDGTYGSYDWTETDHKQAEEDLEWQKDSMETMLRRYLQNVMDLDYDENPEIYNAAKEMIIKISDSGEYGYYTFINDPKTKELLEKAIGTSDFTEDDYSRIFNAYDLDRYRTKKKRVSELEDYLGQYIERLKLVDTKKPLEQAIKDMTKEMKQAEQQRMLTMTQAKVKAQENYIRRIQKEYRDLNKIIDDPSTPTDEWLRATERQSKLFNKIQDAKDELKALKGGKTGKTGTSGTAPRICDYINGVAQKSAANYGIEDDIERYVHRVADSLNISDEEALESINKGLTTMLENSDFTMRIRGDNLVKVLNGGYFKNQFETGTSGGAFSPSTRKSLENRMFGVPMGNEINDSDRPVYGMFCPKWDPNNDEIKQYYSRGPGSWYGDGITVVLNKSKVINNATMTIGDSLDYQHDLGGMDVTDIHYCGSCDSGRRMHAIAQLNENSTKDEIAHAMIDFAHGGDQYFEYQLHGQETHSAGNIEFVIIDEDAARRHQDLTDLLDQMGIPYIINDY